jgi:protein involved in polysaccharide export with SLBB domain
MIKQISFILTTILFFGFCAPVFCEVSGNTNTIDSNFVGDPIIESEYKLGPGDVVDINLIVKDNSLLIENKLTIGPDGKIYFPKVGEISLLGLTIPAARKVVDKTLKNIYNEKYSISFRLIQPRPVQLYLSGSENRPLYIGEKKFVYVYGEVPHTGRFEYIPGRRFSDYLSYAGGPTPKSALGSATLTRQNHKYSINGTDVIFNGNSENDMLIQPGDVINVPSQFFYFTDFGSFSSMILTFVALYNTFIMK